MLIPQGVDGHQMMSGAVAELVLLVRFPDFFEQSRTPALARVILYQARKVGQTNRIEHRLFTLLYSRDSTAILQPGFDARTPVVTI